MPQIPKILRYSLLSSIALSAHAVEIFVAADGSDESSGAREAPTSLVSAIERASTLLQSDGLPASGITITLQGGVYSVTDTITLGKEFAGTVDRPILLQATPGEHVLFDGRIDVEQPESFVPVSDPSERERLAANAAEHIRVATIRNPALIRMLSSKLMLQLNFGDQGFLPCVFPNEDYAKLATKPAVSEPSPPGIPPQHQAYGVRAGHKPFLEPGRKKGWLGSLNEPRGAWAQMSHGAEQMAGSWQQWEAELKRDNRRNAMVGFYEAVWKLSTMPIVSADAEHESLHLARAFAYGFGWLSESRGGQPFTIYGLLPELDTPGEWYFDTKTDRLYIYPIEPITSDSKIGLPVATGFLRLQNTVNVQIVGLNVRNIGAGVVYEIDGGENNLIAGCSISNSTAVGLRITGKNNGTRGCDIYDVNVHASLAGTEFSHVSTSTNSDNRSVAEGKLVLSGNYIENCHFYQKDFDHGKINISMSGVGQIFRNNLVHNSIGQAMMVRGNEQRIERNEFFNIGFEEGDGGAVYSGNDLTGYGNLYRHNFFSPSDPHPRQAWPGGHPPRRFPSRCQLYRQCVLQILHTGHLHERRCGQYADWEYLPRR